MRQEQDVEWHKYEHLYFNIHLLQSMKGPGSTFAVACLLHLVEHTHTHTHTYARTHTHTLTRDIRLHTGVQASHNGEAAAIPAHSLISCNTKLLRLCRAGPSRGVRPAVVKLAGPHGM